MDCAAGQLAKLMELDARHDDLLRRLEALDRRVRRVLAECHPLEAIRQGNEAGAIVAGPDVPTC